MIKIPCQFVVAWAQEILTHTKPQSLETSVFGDVGHHIFGKTPQTHAHVSS